MMAHSFLLSTLVLTLAVLLLHALFGCDVLLPALLVCFGTVEYCSVVCSVWFGWENVKSFVRVGRELNRE